jgi:hypothetical protein
MMPEIFFEIVMFLSHVIGFRCQLSGIQELRNSGIQELEKMMTFNPKALFPALY